MVKWTGRGLVVKRPGVLSKVQMLNLVLGVGVLSLLPNKESLGLFSGLLQSIRDDVVIHFSFFRKSLLSAIFPSAVLGPEMAAPLLWAPGILWFCLLEDLHAHKMPRLRGGGGVGLFLGGSGVEVPTLFLWARRGIFQFEGGTLIRVSPGMNGTVTLCSMRAATVLSRKCGADCGRPSKSR